MSPQSVSILSGANHDPRAVAFFRHVIESLRRARVPVLVGGAYAFEAYTGIGGQTKDLDLFLRPAHVKRALDAIASAGYTTELTAPTWLAKAIDGDDQVDLIFSSGNGVCVVDDEWFAHARRASVLGYRMRLIPIEEMVWSKGFIMERGRFDGGDVVHLIRAARGRLDGDRLLARFGVHWRVLLAHVVLFDYVYPADRAMVPTALRNELLTRASRESGEQPIDGRLDAAALCFGTFLSRLSYVDDVERFGLMDARHA
jgi:hypothetical protein